MAQVTLNTRTDMRALPTSAASIGWSGTATELDVTLDPESGFPSAAFLHGTFDPHWSFLVGTITRAEIDTSDAGTVSNLDITGLSFFLSSTDPFPNGNLVGFVRRLLSGADTITGSNQDDVLLGGAGSDTITGGLGADTTIFSPGYGADTVTDFSIADGDRIDLSNFTQILSFRALLGHVSQNGNDTLLTFDGADVLRLSNVTASTLTVGQFILTAR